ncbi:uncharacterized protein [Ptychodera flava]|uniref:uncharacterized protein n=1 Tax=Ptychodera flava TaxID=63121 RepID=UPI00396A3458
MLPLRIVSLKGSNIHTATIMKHIRPLWRCQELVALQVSVWGRRSFSHCRQAPLMQQINVRKEVIRFDPEIPIERATTPPASWYTEPDLLKLEKNTVFRNNWVAVGRLDQVATPGQFFEGQFADESFIVCRDDNQKLRAFFNVCRHHAMPVAKGEGKLTHFECPYHGWTYALDGRLTKARKLRGIQDFKAKDFGLIPMPVTSWGPLVLVRLVPGQEDAHTEIEHLKPITEMLTESGYVPEKYGFVRRKTYPIKSNWKVIVDNFIDGGYHIDFAHKQFTSSFYDFSTMKMIHANEDFSTQTVDVKADNEYAVERVGKWPTYTHIYPNFMVSRYGPWFETNIVVPKGHDTADFVYDFFLENSLINKFSDKELEDYVDDSIAPASQVQSEDTDLCEGVQAGMNSIAYDVGRYAPRIEFPQHLFHVKLGKDLRSYFEKSSET